MSTLLGASEVQPTWKAPTLVGGKFASQEDMDAFQAALKKGSAPGGAAPGMGNAYQSAATTPDQGHASTPQGIQDAADYRAAAAWGLQNGLLHNTNSSGLPGMSSGKDFLQTWGPILAVAAPAIGGVAFGAGAAAGGSAATGLGNGAVAGGSVGAGSVAGAAGTGALSAGAGASAGTWAAGGGQAIAEDGTVLAGEGITASGTGAIGAASGGTALTSGADTIAPGGIAQDPIAAPAGEAAPSGVGNTPGSAGMGNAGSAPSAAPSLLTQAGDTIGKIFSFGQKALEVGGLLGGLAGLQGGSGSNPSAPEAPPPPPTVGQIPTQADAKQGLMGDPSLAGPSTTWLTGAGGVPDDKLKLGRQTLLGA